MNLELAKSESEYHNSLTKFLIKLSCQDKWVASGIIRYYIENMKQNTSFAHCILTLNDKKKSGLEVCSVLSEINLINDIEMLKQMASKMEHKNNIQSTSLTQPTLQTLVNYEVVS